MKVSELAGLDALLSPFQRAELHAANAEFPHPDSYEAKGFVLFPPTFIATPSGRTASRLQGSKPTYSTNPYPDEVPPLTEGALLAALDEGSVVSTGVVSAPRLSWFYTSQLPAWLIDGPLYAALSHFGVSINRDGDVLRLTLDQEAF